MTTEQFTPEHPPISAAQTMSAHDNDEAAAAPDDELGLAETEDRGAQDDGEPAAGLPAAPAASAEASPAAPPATVPRRTTWLAGILLAIALMVWINVGFKALRLLNLHRATPVVPAVSPTAWPRQTKPASRSATPSPAMPAESAAAKAAAKAAARTRAARARKNSVRRVASRPRRVRRRARRRAPSKHSVILGQGIVLEDTKSIIRLPD